MKINNITSITYYIIKIMNNIHKDIVNFSVDITEHYKTNSNNKKELIEKWSNIVSKVKSTNIIPIIRLSSSISKMFDTQFFIALLISYVSTLPGYIILFSQEPLVLKLDMSSNILEQIDILLSLRTEIYHYKTINLEKTYQQFLKIIEDKDYRMLIIANGNFDDKTLVDRNKDTIFNHEIIFWNIQSKVPSITINNNIIIVKAYTSNLLSHILYNDYDSLKDDEVMNVFW